MECLSVNYPALISGANIGDLYTLLVVRSGMNGMTCFRGEKVCETLFWWVFSCGGFVEVEIDYRDNDCLNLKLLESKPRD